MGILDFLSGQKQSVVTKDRIREAIEILKKYKAGKKNLEQKIIDNERWWKGQHWDLMRPKGANESDPEPVTPYLFNTIANKHADAMDNYPAPNILEREQMDLQEAENLSMIIPLVIDKSEFKETYSDAWWYKLKHGFVIYGSFWNQELEDGLGDIDIKYIDALDIYWEPGIKKLGKSRNIFVTSLVDNDIITENYPWLKGKIEGKKVIDVKQYVYDDNVDITNKSLIIDWYYFQIVNGKKTLQLTKFIDEYVLESTEDDKGEFGPDGEVIRKGLSETGLYDHGQYPFDIDVLFPEEGTCIGFGFIDIVRNPQIYIDKLDQIICKNAGQAGKKRWWVKNGCGINEQEFLDWSKELIHVEGSIDEEHLRELQVAALDAFIVQHRQSKINELKEISGSNDFNRGETGGGVTAASAIMALQEAGNKLSRDMIQKSYSVYAKIIYKCIELVRQFYDEARKFRILGENGQVSYVQYNNARLKMQAIPSVTGKIMYRKPVFDIKVVPEKANPFSKAVHNELAKEMFIAGFFNPQLAPAALVALEMMSFEGKDKVVKMVSQNNVMFQQMQQLQAQIRQLLAYIQAKEQEAGGAQVG
jgi:hypothetical protein